MDDDAAEVVVDVDPVRLTQAFVNIFSANVKQTPPGGVVSVSVAAQVTERAISFEDQGAGISPVAADNVFELFPHAAEQNSVKNWGIGLALGKGLVELNDGKVDMQNRTAGNCAVYTVRPPSLKTAAAALAEVRAADTLGLLFECDEHTVRLAHDGPSAVAEAEEFQPEVIIVDIGLPGLNGNQATKPPGKSGRSKARCGRLSLPLQAGAPRWTARQPGSPAVTCIW